MLARHTTCVDLPGQRVLEQAEFSQMPLAVAGTPWLSKLKRSRAEQEPGGEGVGVQLSFPRTHRASCIGFFSPAAALGQPEESMAQLMLSRGQPSWDFSWETRIH